MDDFGLIRFTWFRALKTWIGYRSFVKENSFGDNTYVLIKGNMNNSNRIVRQFISSGFTEEWPLDIQKERNN